MDKLNWKTVHSADGIMTHYFEHNRIIAMVDKNTGVVYVQKDGQETQRIDVSRYSINQYLDLMRELTEADSRLNNFYSNQCIIDAQCDCGNKTHPQHSEAGKFQIQTKERSLQQTHPCNGDLEPEKQESSAVKNKRIFRWYERLTSTGKNHNLKFGV